MKSILYRLGLTGTVVAVLAVSGATAFAEGGTGGSSGSGDSTSTTITTSSGTTNETENSGSTSTGATETETGSSEHGTVTSGKDSNESARLSMVKERVCQNRQNAVNHILSRIVTRGENQLALFNSIAQKVEAFKTSKNLTVSNYDQLVAKLQADQTKAQADLTAMKANQTLDCTSSDPKGMVTAFQTDLKQEITDLKTYKTDVKNLIVAVKTAAGDTNSSDSTNHSTTGGNQ